MEEWFPERLSIRVRRGKDEEIFLWVEEESRKRKLDRSDILREALMEYFERRQKNERDNRI